MYPPLQAMLESREACPKEDTIAIAVLAITDEGQVGGPCLVLCRMNSRLIIDFVPLRRMQKLRRW